MGEVSSVVGSNSDVARKILDVIGLDKIEEFFTSSRFADYIGPTLSAMLIGLLGVMAVYLVVKVVLEII